MPVPDRAGRCSSPVGPQEADDRDMLALFRTSIRIVRCKVPKQPNAHDCGVYVVKFAKMVLDAMPRTSCHHLRDDLRSQLDQTAFTQSDVDTERLTIRALIERY
jgi:Ulp1 family protease